MSARFLLILCPEVGLYLLIDCHGVFCLKFTIFCRSHLLVDILTNQEQMRLNELQLAFLNHFPF